MKAQGLNRHGIATIVLVVTSALVGLYSLYEIYRMHQQAQARNQEYHQLECQCVAQTLVNRVAKAIQRDKNLGLAYPLGKWADWMENQRQVIKQRTWNSKIKYYITVRDGQSAISVRASAKFLSNKEWYPGDLDGEGQIKPELLHAIWEDTRLEKLRRGPLMMQGLSQEEVHWNQLLKQRSWEDLTQSLVPWSAGIYTTVYDMVPLNLSDIQDYQASRVRLACNRVSHHIRAQEIIQRICDITDYYDNNQEVTEYQWNHQLIRGYENQLQVIQYGHFLDSSVQEHIFIVLWNGSDQEVQLKIGRLGKIIIK